MRVVALSLAVFSLALARNEDYRESLRLALRAHEAGDLQSAVKRYRAILGSHPELLAVRTNMAAALAGLGRFDEAAEAYRVAVECKPDDAEIRLNFGQALYQAGRLDDAADAFRVVHEIHPENAQLTILLAECELRRGHPDAALALLDPMTNRDRNAEYLRGMALIRVNRAEEGIRPVAQYAHDTNDPDALLLAGVTQLNLGRIADARQTLDLLAALKTPPPTALTWAGLAHDRSGDEDGASALFARAIVADPSNADAHLHWGAILFRDKDYEAARVHIEKALALQPDSLMALYAHALVIAALHQEELAVTLLQKITAKSPEWLEPHAKLAALYFKFQRNVEGERERAILDDLNASHKGKSSPFETQ